MNNYSVDIISLTSAFLSINAIAFIVGFLASKLTANRKRLESKGYPESYIIYEINFSKKFRKIYIVVILLLELFFSIITLLILKSLSHSEFLAYVFIPSVLFSIPFAAFYSTKANKDYKRLAEEEGHDVVVDFQRKFLKLIFNLPLEITASIAVTFFAIIILPFRNSLVIYLYVILPWFFSFVLMFSKNNIKPTMKDSYLKIGKMIIIYQGILVFLLIVETLEIIVENNPFTLIALIAICLFLIGKIIFYIPGYKKLKIKLDDLIE